MPTAMAGQRGGNIGSRRNRTLIDFTHALLSGNLDQEQIARQLRSRTVPKTATLVLNNACNLACRHCYLQVDRLTDNALSRDEWKVLLRSILESGVELICLSGKEVFLGNQGADLISFISEEKRHHNVNVRLGLITNGTLIHKHRKTILDAELDYFDISLDGIEADHDAVRGSGSFAQLRPNLEWASKALGSNLFVNLTLQQQNFRRLKETVLMLDTFGVQNIGCGFYIPLGYTDPQLSLSDQDIANVFEQLAELEGLSLKCPKTILIDQDTLHMPALLAFMRSRWFDPDKMMSDAKDNLYVEHVLANGIVLQFRFAPFPSLVHESSRITPEGNYLATDDTIDAAQYAARILANVREYNCDFTAMHAVARRASRIESILDNYLEFVLPCLISEFNERFPAHASTAIDPEVEHRELIHV